MPFLATPRVTNSTDGRVSVQITDLYPHKTQSNATISPNFKGPVYLYGHTRDISQDVALDVNFATTTDLTGLAVYLLTTVENTAAAGIALTSDQANDIADALILRMRSAQSLTIADINAVIVENTAAGNDLDGILGNSTGTVLEVLQIISGYKVFSIPAGQDVQDAGAFVPLAGLDQAGSLTNPADYASLWSDFNNHPSFWISAKRGQLRKAQERVDASGNPAPYVVIYGDDGSLYI
jgi:hypothetical protein